MRQLWLERGRCGNGEGGVGGVQAHETRGGDLVGGSTLR